jgi:hypothetical protein
MRSAAVLDCVEGQVRAVQLLAPMRALGMHGVGWAVLTPALIRLSRRFDV